MITNLDFDAILIDPEHGVNIQLLDNVLSELLPQVRHIPDNPNGGRWYGEMLPSRRFNGGALYEAVRS